MHLWNTFGKTGAHNHVQQFWTEVSAHVEVEELKIFVTKISVFSHRSFEHLHSDLVFSNRVQSSIGESLQDNDKFPSLFGVPFHFTVGISFRKETSTFNSKVENEMIWFFQDHLMFSDLFVFRNGHLEV